MAAVHFSNDPHQIVQVDYPPTPRNRVRFERMTSREERAEGFKVLKIFRKYDTDRDGFLSVCELKKLVERNPEQCKDIPKGVTEHLHQTHDENNDGKLDFEEFYKLARKNHWVVADWCAKYCEYIIPPRCATKHQKFVTAQVARGPVAYTHVDQAASFSAVNQYDTIDSFEYEEDQDYEDLMKFWPPPLTMVIFSILEIVCFVIDIIYLKDYNSDINEMGRQVNGPVAQLFIYNPRKRHEAWRFVTYMFVHVGVMHLMMNLLVQLFLGTFLELGIMIACELDHSNPKHVIFVHCWWRVALVYLSGVAAGSMGTSIASPNIYLAGASGGVYALITAHVASIIMNWQQMRSGVIQLFVFLVYIGTDIGMSVHRHMTDPFDRVGYMAHLCGGAAGLLVGIGVLRNLQQEKYEKYLWWIAVTIYSMLMIAGICFHIFYPEHFLDPRANIPKMASADFTTFST